ncbi:MAG: hypothetical protein QGI13_03530 [Rhodospirillales bacterium]|jgi:hypothetical protein|nr:hypothetical protein [Rhodospirillales bacterium]
MKGKTLTITAVAVAAVLGTAAIVANPVSAGGPGWRWHGIPVSMDGPGMRGYGHGMMGGPAMMGYGHGAGSGGPCWHGQAALDKELNTADVTKWVERHLAMQGNDRLKAGPVTEKDAGTIVADIVTADDSLVWRFEFDRVTGRMSRVD